MAVFEQYVNADGESNVEAYEIGTDSITVRFRDGTHYLYDHTAPGAADVERMKDLAAAGRGLNSFITKTVKTRYARKWK
jgi:hypothetical protein